MPEDNAPSTPAPVAADPKPVGEAKPVETGSSGPSGPSGTSGNSGFTGTSGQKPIRYLLPPKHKRLPNAAGSGVVLICPPGSRLRAEKHPMPNQKCPCGSGKKYKKCCGRLGAQPEVQEEETLPGTGPLPPAPPVPPAPPAPLVSGWTGVQGPSSPEAKTETP